MPARLTIHHPNRPSRILVLPEGRPTTLGRDPSCDLVLDDDRVSRQHARFEPGEAGWRIADLGSKNGTLVEGAPLTGAPLGASCWISFGGVIARFDAEGGAAFDERDLRRLTTALALQRALDPAVGLEALLPRVVRSMLELTEAERGCVLLVGAEGALEVAAHSGLASGVATLEPFGGSLGAVHQALESGEAVVCADALADAGLGDRSSVIAGEIRALLCVPILALDRVLGALYADSRQPGAAFTELDLDLLLALASQAGLAIAVARLDREIRTLARRLQDAPDSDAGLRSRLSEEVTAVLDRSLPAARRSERPLSPTATSPGSTP